jgi:molybdopterin/thiamine biosynthesis adenylyltransferase
MLGDAIDSRRIDHLLTPSALQDKVVVVIGLGSGSFPAMQHLAMCGVSQWILFDKDVLDEVNLVKHPGMRKDLGKSKTVIGKEWILDRNPSAIVINHDVDITTVEGEKLLEDAIGNSSIVLCGTDNQNTREIVSRICVLSEKACVFALIYRTGFGGDAYLYDPGITGCYECFLKTATTVNVGRMLDDAKLASTVENPIDSVRYGRVQDPKYGLSGLSIDIQFISLLQARLALSYLLGQNNENLEQALSQSPDNATQAEQHMLHIPYTYRGPEKVDEMTFDSSGKQIGTIWWNTNENARYLGISVCGNCNWSIHSEEVYCSQCGFFIEEEGQELDETSFETSDAPKTTLKRIWRGPSGMPPGYGINYVQLINRRMIIDHLKKDDSGETVGSGNTHVVAKPFNFQTGLIGRHPDCEWCKIEEEE